MLADLYSELVDLHYQLQRLAHQHRQREAGPICDRILEVEGRISSLPALTVEDAAVKLRLLRVEIGGGLGERQRQIFDEVITVLNRHCRI